MIVALQSSGLWARIVSVVPLPEIHAGSALVWYDGRLLVVQDDAASAVWVDPASGQTERWVLEGHGEPLEKAQKPDFEVAFLGPGRVVTILGSGSSLLRRRRAVVDLDSRVVRMIEENALFKALDDTLGGMPNLEGAVLAPDTLRLFHRGAGADKSATIDVNVGVLSGESPQILKVTHYDLGHVDGVPLHFTDATPWGTRIAYLAVAENTSNAMDDGAILGAAFGLLAEDGTALWTPLVEADGTNSIRKVEGMAIDPRTATAYGVTDPDDPEKPAELLTLEIVGQPAD